MTNEIVNEMKGCGSCGGSRPRPTTIRPIKPTTRPKRF